MFERLGAAVDVSSEQISATFAGLSALAAVVTAVLAARSLSASRQDSRDRTRPIVVAHFQIAPSFTHGYTYLVIQNVGQSLARNLTVKFDPAIYSDGDLSDAGNGITTERSMYAQRYAAPIQLIGPGERLANVYRTLSDGEGERLPDELSVELTYEDEHGRGYAESLHLDIRVYGAETRGNPADDNWDKRQAKALEAAVWELWRQ